MFAIYAALYDERGELRDLAQGGKMIKSNYEEGLAAELALPDSNLDSYQLKVFVWENTEKGFVPMLKTAEING